MKQNVMVCLAALGAASCAASTGEMQPKQAQIGAHAAVQAAEALIGSYPTPRAEANLAAARDDVMVGQRLMVKENYEVARLYFERAQAEASAAIAQARAKEAEAKTARLTQEPSEPQVPAEPEEGEGS